MCRAIASQASPMVCTSTVTSALSTQTTSITLTAHLVPCWGFARTRRVRDENCVQTQFGFGDPCCIRTCLCAMGQDVRSSPRVLVVQDQDELTLANGLVVPLEIEWVPWGPRAGAPVEAEPVGTTRRDVLGFDGLDRPTRREPRAESRESRVEMGLIRFDGQCWCGDHAARSMALQLVDSHSAGLQ